MLEFTIVNKNFSDYNLNVVAVSKSNHDFITPKSVDILLNSTNSSLKDLEIQHPDKVFCNNPNCDLPVFLHSNILLLTHINPPSDKFTRTIAEINFSRFLDDSQAKELISQFDIKDFLVLDTNSQDSAQIYFKKYFTDFAKFIKG